MAPIADERLAKVAGRRRRAQDHARRGPRGRRSRHRRGAARQPAPGRRAARRAGRLLAGRHAGRRPRDARTSSCSSPTATTSRSGSSASATQAKSGDPQLRAEVAELEKLLAHVDAGGRLADYPGELPPELEPLTTKPIIPLVNGPGGIDGKLEAELAELPEEEAAAFREGPSALGEVVLRLFEALDLISFFTAGDKETRAWTLRRGRDGVRRCRDHPHRHRPRLHPCRGDPLERPRRCGLARRGVDVAGSSGSRGRATSSRTATC